MWLVLAILAVLTLFWTRTTPVFAPVASDSSRSRPLTPSNPEITRGEKIERIDRYFEKRQMPLAGYGQKFIEAAEKCGMDWRLLPAIAVRESSGGKQMTQNNPFGWGSAKIGFENLDQAVDIVGWNLCGLNLKTSVYYKDKTASEKLWSYNGTINPKYPDEVLAIMDQF